MQGRWVLGDALPGAATHHHDGLHLLLPAQVSVTRDRGGRYFRLGVVVLVMWHRAKCEVCFVCADGDILWRSDTESQ